MMLRTKQREGSFDANTSEQEVDSTVQSNAINKCVCTSDISDSAVFLSASACVRLFVVRRCSRHAALLISKVPNGCIFQCEGKEAAGVLQETFFRRDGKRKKKNCSYDCCTTTARFSVTGSKSPVYCKQHAEDGMVNIRSKRCAYVSCTKMPSYNVEGMKPPTFCKPHAKEGMVDVIRKCCSHGPCTKYSYYNVKGTNTPMYCKERAEDGMVHACRKLCSHGSCTKQPNFNVDGMKSPVCCRQHLTTEW